MTVRKDEPMDHLAATDEEFDALLDTSSLGAPYVVAATGDIPVTARSRMAQAVRRQRRTLAMPGDTSHPRTDDTADSQPQVPAVWEAMPQEAWPVYVVLHGAMRAGKSSILAALSAFGDSSPRSGRPSLARWAWAEPSPDGLRSTLWLTGALDEAVRAGSSQKGIAYGDGIFTLFRRADALLARIESGWLPGASDEGVGAGSSQEGSAHGDGIDTLFKRQDALAGLAASIGCPSAGAQTVPTVTAAGLQVTQLLWPDVETCMVPGRHAVRPGRYPQGVWNLRHLIEPHLQYDQSLGSAATTELPMCPTPVTRLLISRFTTCAYAVVDGGLLVPQADSTPRDRHQVQETSVAGCDLGQPAGTRMRLRQTLADGVRALSAELPMLFHLDERESLALTSSLPTRLTYRVSDPYAVEARFRAGDRDETVWIFARDLLRQGLERRSGLGDVAVWPGHEARRIFIRISSPEGSALLSAADADLRVFLGAASNLVPYGAEPPHLLPALNALETAIGELARPGRCE
ncbi:SsgA family sporulation/cell division regulator [Streptomyces sp. NPDC019531]|uniref:SsgA family sporulation/cell division regulator n=1 Tax=Streptomyces sp. NPDC019531 TaxID=3365062 RepID=UPI00384F50EA